MYDSGADASRNPITIFPVVFMRSSCAPAFAAIDIEDKRVSATKVFMVSIFSKEFNALNGVCVLVQKGYASIWLLFASN